MAKWTELLRRAAARTTRSTAYLEDALRQALGAIYRRLADQGAVLKRHPGVGRFTLERVKPELRRELDRRILASANLIRLNRTEAISNTLRRFEGWSTSIPKGGSEQVNRRKTKGEIGKPLQSLPFVERRVLIDQGHKLTAAINETVAKSGGAIACQWHSHWREPNYNYRPDHKERDKAVYLLRDSWALDKGLIKAGPAGYYDKVTAVGEEPFCFPGDSRIPYAESVEKAYRRWYAGDLVSLTLASGKVLRATPNHPVLTPNGWLAVGLLKEGDDVIEVAKKQLLSVKIDDDDAVPTIAEIFCAVSELGIVATTDGATHQFHGDGSSGNVDIVGAARELTFGVNSKRVKLRDNIFFAVSHHCGTMIRALKFFCQADFVFSTRFMRGVNELLAAFFTFARHANRIGFATASDGCTKSFEALSYGPATNSKMSGERQHTLPSFMSFEKLDVVDSDTQTWGDAVSKVDQTFKVPSPQQADADSQSLSNLLNGIPFATQFARVVKIDRQHFSGHVFNLQTKKGWYVTEGIITHNCRCYLTFFYNLRQLPSEMLTAKGASELKRVSLG
ncbi:MAG: hypothetical protein KGL39_41160 [Patescibacteria group bacterium]|nr:hypothetical protein [Patescibacteria group bacterium]